MSRTGDEMILELAAALGGFDKTAAKKKEEKPEKEDKKEKFEEEVKGKKKVKKEEKEEKGKKKEEKEEVKGKKKVKKEEKEEKGKGKKKAKALMEIVNGLSKLASELDEIGAEEASSLVDDALKVIVYNMDHE